MQLLMDTLQIKKKNEYLMLLLLVFDRFMTINRRT